MYANLLAKSWDSSQSVSPPAHARLLPHLRAAKTSADAIYESVGALVLANLGLDNATWGGRLRAALSLAALIHDLGKANDYFQGMVRGEARFPATTQPIRHELVGVLLLLGNKSGTADWLQGHLAEENNADVTTALFRSVIGAVAGHHLKMDAEWSKALRPMSGGGTRLEILLGHPDLRRLFGGSTGAGNESWPLLPSHPDSPSKASRVFRRDHAHWLDFLARHEDWRRFAGALKALVVAADVAASAILPEGVNPRQWIKDALANRLDRDQARAVVSARLQGHRPRPFQEVIADTGKRVTLVEAGCGTGKTAGAYLWAARNAVGRKLFFCYPTTGTATEGYLGYVHDSDVEAALVHSRAAVDLEGIATSAEDPGEEEALRIHSLNLWRPQAVVCTVDTVLALARNNRKGLYGSPAILSGAFVFDELHAYDDNMFEAVVALILALPGAPFLLMSASLPAVRKKFLERHVGTIGQVPRPADLEEIPRYRFAHAPVVEDAFDAAVVALGRGQRVLWVCNTVARAQSVFDRATDAGLPVTAYHSRFRYHDRVARHREVVQAFAHQDGGGCLAVTTQVAEMSLDLDAHLLVTELAPVPALIQRLGRHEDQDEVGPHRHPERQVRPRPHAGKRRRPTLVQRHPPDQRRTPDREGRRETARHDALDFLGQNGRQVAELIPVRRPPLGASARNTSPEVLDPQAEIKSGCNNRDLSRRRIDG